MACIRKLSLILKERRAFLAFYTDALKKINPKVVCYTHGEETFCCFLREAAQELDIPTVEINHGAVIKNLIYPKSLTYSDYYLTYSDILTNHMRKRGLKNVFTVGKPSIYSDINSFRQNKPFVVSFISSLEAGFFEKAKALAEKLDKNRYIVVYKTHPIERWEEREFEQLSEEFENLVFIDGSVDVRELYEKSDIVIGIRSSGILDALPYVNIKILVLEDEYAKASLAGSVSEIFTDLNEFGDIVRVDNEETLFKEVLSYERGRDYRNK